MVGGGSYPQILNKVEAKYQAEYERVMTWLEENVVAKNFENKFYTPGAVLGAFFMCRIIVASTFAY